MKWILIGLVGVLLVVGIGFGVSFWSFVVLIGSFVRNLVYINDFGRFVMLIYIVMFIVDIDGLVIDFVIFEIFLFGKNMFFYGVKFIDGVIVVMVDVVIIVKDGDIIVFIGIWSDGGVKE